MSERVPKNRIAYRSAGNAKNLNLKLSSVTEILTTFAEVIVRVNDPYHVCLLTCLASLSLIFCSV